MARVSAIFSMLVVVICDVFVTRAEDPVSTEKNIAFDLPDIITTIEARTGTYQLEAYRSVNNDEIMQKTGSNQTSQLFWVSIGQPNFVKTPDARNVSVTRTFHFSRNGFSAYIEMLTAQQRRVLADAARAKYRLAIEDNQVVNLVLSSFDCSLVMYDDVGNNYNKYLLKGRVSSFRQFPLRIDFAAPTTSAERRLFEYIVGNEENDADLIFECSIASAGELKKFNKLTITSEQQQQIGLDEKLFGNAGSNEKSVYVTRNQMTQLASEMYKSLNIIEDYQVPEMQFKTDFVDGLIEQLAASTFDQVPVDSVLSSLSKYGFDVSGDLKPDIIKHELSSILKVENRGETSRIILDEENYSEHQNSQSTSGGIDVGFGGFSGGINWAKENSRTDITSNKSLSDQLRELNTASRDEAQWEFDGEKIVPKSLNVARLTRSRMSTTLSFSRIQMHTIIAPFQRSFNIYTRVAEATTSFLEQLTARIEAEEKVVAVLNNALSSLQAQLTNNANRIIIVNSQLTSQMDSHTNSLNQRINDVNSQLTSSINAVSASAVRRCRICFWENSGTTNGQCAGNKNSCSGWSDQGSAWTGAFYDDTDAHRGGCQYQWRIECTQ